MTENGELEARRAQYRAAFDDVWGRSVSVLSEAVRMRDPDGWPVDFAEFLASALATVAANVGSVERLLAGRPGSWEADKVRDLLYSTVGYDEDALFQHRTDPVVIHLNVHRVVLDNATGPVYETPYEAELYEIGERYARLSDAEYAAAEQAEQAELEAAEEKWAGHYAAYAEAFTAAVQTAAAQIEGLQVPVRVETETAPNGGASDTTPPHPEDLDYNDPHFDPLALRLWEAARRAVPLPDSDIDSDGDTPSGGRDV